MEKIVHPVSGEQGYFISETEKRLFDTSLHYSVSQLVPSRTPRGVDL